MSLPKPIPRRHPSSIFLVTSLAGSILWSLAALEASAQINAQDCPGAIPVCQELYAQANGPPNGQGFIPNELPATSCMAANERNSAWYVFTVQSGGTLSFTITPNNPVDDYDWAVYNLTNNGCAAIAGSPGLEVSCNFSATPGVTGPNGQGTAQSQNAAGTPFNASISVAAGETYVVNVSNFDQTAQGYTLDFSNSTATILDDVAPALSAVAPPSCSGGPIDVDFDEFVLCNTVEPADFRVIGPGGPYEVTSVNGANCGNQESTFQITTSPPLMSSGNFQVCLGSGSGSVTDLCGNLAAPACRTIEFTASEQVAVQAANQKICQGESTTLTAIGDGSITWLPSGQSTSSITVSPSATTQYTARLVDPSGCSSTASAEVEVSDLSVDAGKDLISCSGDQQWTLNAMASGGTSATVPVTYEWSHGANSATTTVPATPGSHSVTVTDSEGCQATDKVEVFSGGELNCRNAAEFNNTNQLPRFTQRSDTIIAAKSGAVTVKSTDFVTYRAGREIRLYPRFKVQRGGSFEARIGDCWVCTRPQVQIRVESDKCTSELFAEVEGGRPPYSLHWSGGLGSSGSIKVDTDRPQTHTVTVTDSASLSNTASVTLGTSGFWGKFPGQSGSSYLSSPSALRKSAPPGNLAGRMTVYHVDPPNIPDITLLNPAYNANRFQLQIFDRWGNLIYVQDEKSSSGFANGAIYWEGFVNIPFGGVPFRELVYRGPILEDSASKVPIGVYNWQLVLFNCSSPSGALVVNPARKITVVD